MRRDGLHVEITSMEHAHLLVVHTHVADCTVLAKLPSLEQMCLSIYNHIFVFYRIVDSLHVHRQFPALSPCGFIKKMVRVPIAQRRVVAEQSDSFSLIDLRCMDLEDNGLLEKRQVVGTDVGLADAVLLDVKATIIFAFIHHPSISKKVVAACVIFVFPRRKQAFPALHFPPPSCT